MSEPDSLEWGDMGTSKRFMFVRAAILAIATIAGAVATQVTSSYIALAGTCTGDASVEAQDGQTYRGVQVSSPGMTVGDTSVDCVRVSVVEVINAARTKVAAVGWYEDTTGSLNCPSTQSDNRPRVLRLKIANGVLTCDQTTNTYDPANLPTDDGFKVHDDNQDGTWDYYRNGNLIGSYDFGSFTTGDLRDHTERYSDSGDSAYGNFDGLKQMGSSGNWNDWSGTAFHADDDPGYVLCIRSDTHTEHRPTC